MPRKEGGHRDCYKKSKRVIAIDFKTVNANQVLKDDFVNEYRKGISFFYSQLVNLNVNLFIIDKIRKFPFKIFCNASETIFFSMVLNNFFEVSVLTITRLVTDTAGDLYTLPKLKNSIRANIKPEYLNEYSELLRTKKFDAGVNTLLGRAKILRNESIAHIKKEAIEQTEHLKISELESLRDALNDLLDSISFDVTHLMLPIEYDEQVQHPEGTDSRSDIERILDRVAFDSRKLNLPEVMPQIWPGVRSKMSPQELEIFNSYRRKLRLSEA